MNDFKDDIVYMNSSINVKANIRGSLILVFVALIWGVAFVAQGKGMDHVGPFTFNGIRMALGGLALGLIIPLLDKFKFSSPPSDRVGKNKLLLGGVLSGIVLFGASTIQQVGLIYAPPGKAGFITALYIVFVPIFSVFIGQKIASNVWISVVLATVGMYFLCFKGDASISGGDIILLVSAVLFAIHIIVIGKFAPFVDCVRLSCIQFLVAGVLGLLGMVIFESPSLDAILSCKTEILYTGLCSTAIAYTLQVVAQKGMHPTVASLVMSLESVFSVLAGAVILQQILSASETAGCVLIFVASILSQLPERSASDIVRYVFYRKRS